MILFPIARAMPEHPDTLNLDCGHSPAFKVYGIREKYLIPYTLYLAPS